MHIDLAIPDDLAHRLGPGDALARRALEACAAEEYRAGRLTRSELERLLSFANRAALVGFLEARGLADDAASAGNGGERRDPDAAANLVARFRAFSADKNLGGIDPVELIRQGRR